MRVLATDLQFPEGPIWLPDGSVVLVEINAGVLTRVWPDGKKTTVANTGGGPNGAAIGPDGHIYVCNNGGALPPGKHPAPQGRIERVNLDTGKFEVLYEEVGGHHLSAPNDIVFDAQGGFWFTDLGKTRERDRDRGGIYYAKPDGSFIREVIYPMETPNGIGLSPDGKTLYVAESTTARLWAFDVTAPGQVYGANKPIVGRERGRLVYASPTFLSFDSLGVEANGNICVASLFAGGITVCAPGGGRAEFVPTGDERTTNICFGGAGLQKAYITLSGVGQLIEMDWPRPGLRLNY